MARNGRGCGAKRCSGGWPVAIGELVFRGPGSFLEEKGIKKLGLRRKRTFFVWKIRKFGMY